MKLINILILYIFVLLRILLKNNFTYIIASIGPEVLLIVPKNQFGSQSILYANHNNIHLLENNLS